MASIVNYFRSKAVIGAIRPFMISDEINILDIGAGSCHVAKTLATKYHLNVTAIDMVDHNITDFPLQLYDGKRLPYADDSFSVGLLVFVLHHASDVDGLLREAGRVCKKLIIVEDLPGNIIERCLWKRLDYLLNHAQHSDIAVAHEATSVEDWKLLFEKCGYTLAKTKRFRSVFTTGLLYPHAVFVLNRSNT